MYEDAPDTGGMRAAGSSEASPPALSLLILAGGLAERMGECKVLLPIGDESALSCLVSRARALGAADIANIANIADISIVTGGHEEKICGEAERLGLRVVYNPAYESGMFSSVLAGVGALSPDTDAFFLLPADTPLVKPSTYRSLAEVFFSYPAFSRPDVAYPTFQGRRGHPPLISRSLVADIMEWSGAGGLRGMFEARGVKWVEVPTGDRSVLLDMDTPDDYAALKEYAYGERFPDGEECAELLDIAGTPAEVADHMNAVAGHCMSIAGALASCGVEVNGRLLASAAMLHDIAKTCSNHDIEGARLLRERGYPEVADIVGAHKDMQLEKKSIEAEILYLSDRITDGCAFITIEERMRRMALRFSEDGAALDCAGKRLATALAIQRKFEEKTGRSLDEMLSRPIL